MTGTEQPDGAASVPTLVQNDGHRIPQLGLGLAGPSDEEAAATVQTALGMGYRLLDTAAVYGNERGVGEGIRRSGTAREELYVTTKLADDRHGYDEALAACQESLDRLGLDHVDLYLIHWPMPRTGRYVETWRALATLVADGRARSVGVSNFQPHHLQRLLEETGLVPALNQVELHPGLQQAEVRRFDAAHGILTQAWSPLGRRRLFGEPVLQALAQKHGRSVAQVILRWHVQNGVVAIPKSVTPGRLAQNIDVFGFALDTGDMAAVAGLDRGARIGDDPDQHG